jgi:hypothetical protein
MSNLTTIDLKAFVPSKDFELSKRFYSRALTNSALPPARRL